MITNSPMFNEAKAIANFGGRFAFATSLGRDSAVMLHIMNQLTDLKKHKFFHWSFYPQLLPYQSKYLEKVKKMYGIEVDVFLHPNMIKKKQMPWVVDYTESNGCNLALFGYKMADSLQRRGMLNKLTDGIDYQRKWAYPLRSWSTKTLRGYITANKVPLNIEYNLGMPHEMNEHRGNQAFILRHMIGEEDYQAAIAQDPRVEIDYIRSLHDEEFQRILRDEK